MSELTRYQTGPRMSQAVRHGDTVYTAGQVAKGATVTDQTRAILSQIDALLEAAGSGKDRLISATIWLTDIGDFAEMNAVWDAWVAPGATPCRACVQSALAAPEYRVEIQVIAAA